jgi:hypothetical protein
MAAINRGIDNYLCRFGTEELEWENMSAIRRFCVTCLVLTLGFCVIQMTSLNRIRASNSSKDKIKKRDLYSAERIVVDSAGRGRSWINMRDCYQLPHSYEGLAEFEAAVAGGSFHPLAMTSADFDEDGIPDLVSGYAGPQGGMLTLHRGNRNAIYPNSPKAIKSRVVGTFADSPFLSPAHVFNLPFVPQLLGVGDFNADGHQDLVATSYGSTVLHFLLGNGRAAISQIVLSDLREGVTALAVGDLNRTDGLADVAIGVVGKNGARALVLESPLGAMLASPEIFQLPAVASSIAIEHLDDGAGKDLAISAGKRLVIIHGRDRRLSIEKINEVEVEKAEVEQITLPFAVASMASGNFTGDYRIDLAILSEDGRVGLLGRSGKSRNWNLSNRSTAGIPTLSRTSIATMARAQLSNFHYDDLLLVDSANRQLHILVGERADAVSFDLNVPPVALLPMRLNGDAVSDLVVLKEGEVAPAAIVSLAAATFTVVNTNNSGEGSLRQAILDANANADSADTIVFKSSTSPATDHSLSAQHPACRRSPTPSS